MNPIPDWAALLASLLIVAAGLLALVGTLGLWRFESFYQRMHGPTMVTTFATLFSCAASALYFSMAEGKPVIHEILIAIFVALTPPITTMLLARAALYRHRRAGKEVPGKDDLRGGAAADFGELADETSLPELPSS
ncbi:Na+/H+ antiporter subunit G [Pigmentiphaga soli]|uniref:Na+/H+ antiporter subunit G n=1 Tax=Pigmentiphaga soli TaxID=1007095 RepID=A0ABP8GJT9_9BURK